MKRLRYLLILALFLVPAHAAAETFKSTNYSVGESYIGPGGLIDSSSAGYRMGNSSIGDTGVGTSARPKVVLKDDMEVFGGWNAIGSGTVGQSSAQAHGGTFSLLKDTNGHPNGGYKLLSSAVTRDWRAEMWVRKDTDVASNNAIRIGIEADGFIGYAFHVVPGSANFVIDRLNSGATQISSTAGTALSYGAWYRVVLESSSSGLIKLDVYEAGGTRMGGTQVVDTTHTGSFDRITVRGGYPYYVDDIEVSNTNAGYRTDSGAPTPNEPRLNLMVNTSAVDLGILSTGTTKTGTAAFSVTNYLSHGYVVYIAGGAPTNNGRQLTPLAANTASTAGTEQFGINLVANTAPAAFGADPAQKPDGSFSYGRAADNYKTPNSYRFVNGEVVAQSSMSTGQTDYTVSYIANIAPLTPAGLYSARQSIIVVGTY